MNKKLYIAPYSLTMEIKSEDIICVSGDVDNAPRNNMMGDAKYRNSAFPADYSLSDGWE